MSDSVQPHRRQPTRLPRPWDSPGKNTGVGCHFLLQCMKVKSESEVAPSCPTLSDLMDCRLPGSSVHGISQARVLEWVAIAFSNYSLAPINTCVWTFTAFPLDFVSKVVGAASASPESLLLIQMQIFSFISALLKQNLDLTRPPGGSYAQKTIHSCFPCSASHGSHQGCIIKEIPRLLLQEILTQ